MSTGGHGAGRQAGRPGGNTLEVDAKNDRLTVCHPTTGDCDHVDLPISGTGTVKLGGTSYES